MHLTTSPDSAEESTEEVTTETARKDRIDGDAPKDEEAKRAIQKQDQGKD